MLRYLAYGLCVVMAVVSLASVLWLRSGAWAVAAVVFIALAWLGTLDLLQRQSTLRRNYPLTAHFRFLLENFRPEIRQYFIENDQDEVPFSRQQRDLVYRRAKNVSDVVPFGSELPMYGSSYEWINHSLAPAHAASHDFRVPVGEERAQPYAASVFNISAMSFGSLSANAIRALNRGAKLGNFFHDTGEGAISRYHREAGGDLVWEIGSGYFGCRDATGRFDEARFADNAAEPQVKMIEIKLSQGAKPGHGGMLPGAKVTAEIAATRGIPEGVDCESPAAHSAFSTPIGLLEFVERLRARSGGKPTGFKLAIGHPWEWFGIAKAMQETGILPDFIVVDGAEGGTGAAPSEFINHVGLPLQEGLMLVHNTLVGIGLRDRVRVAAAGRITSGFDIARALAMGADWCNAGRGFMFALGCIQSRSCHTDQCPTGVATQDPARWRTLDVGDKAERVFHFHQNTLKALRDMLGAAGLEHPMQLGPEHILRRVSPTEVRSLAALYRFLEPGELVGGVPEHAVFRTFWPVARADSFAPPARVRTMEAAKSH
ncbi:FMN-binding glutamate synthase family protein [Luteimonas sp. BDR2-5]|uniref:FMN-binding glutamate synthase family protein n=1 Tax=Proluteimonas luteida TaxID=2878685 RepID=UPI001E3A1075|nr:FMN-binding glutamate synthase family protein [Luteimonas sp. BDR2-5]MCD9027717.1 FMN-binding glutamate synthase family protein [Luteimonas sp. BDR2-5]